MNKTVIAYVPQESPVYRLHPVTRLVFFLVTGFLPVFVARPAYNLTLVGLFVGLFLVSRVDLRQLRIYLPMLVTVGLFITLSYVLFPGHGASRPVLFRWGPLAVSRPALAAGLDAYVRVLALLAASLYYFYTNRERDILVGLRTLRVPFVATYFVGLTLRVAGMFLEDFRTIREAQLARGLDVARMGFLARLKLYALYMVPMLAIALRRGEEISQALFAKGFSLRMRTRSDYLAAQRRLTLLDKGFMSGSVALLVAVLALRAGGL